jgi:N-acetylmuramoyl-L-alanine amidase
MPSILVELGFINNPAEEQYLNSEKGQNQMAKALYQAFAAYKKDFESDNRVVARNTPKPKETEKPAPTEKSEPAGEQAESKTESSETAEESPVENTGDTYYTVQISTIKKKKPVTDEAFNGVKDVTVEEYNGVYRYYSGRFQTRAEANARVKEVAKRGFNDAFVVYYQNGERKRLE